MSIAELSNDFDHVTKHLPAEGTIAYVDFPVHKNAGDILIFLGTMELFRRHNIKIGRTLSTLDMSSRHLDHAAGAETIVCHGGGNLGDIYPRPQALREAIITRAQDAKVIIFPQSIQFHDPARLRTASEIFRKHENLTVFTRDQPSFDLAKRHLAEEVVLSQDMAHALYDWLAPIRAERPRREDGRQRTLQFLRQDLEVGQTPDIDLSSASHVDGPIDWPDLLTLNDKLLFEAYRRAAVASKLLPVLPIGFLLNYEAFCKRLIIRLARRFIQYDHVVTSRLHGAIFSLLLDRRVTVIDNSYGKNSRYADQWLKDVPNLEIGFRSDVKSAGM
ncbi:MAG: polysaccharide pyruvyl transferase family protein [Pseudomonadota bacterium]